MLKYKMLPKKINKNNIDQPVIWMLNQVYYIDSVFWVE